MGMKGFSSVGTALALTVGVAACSDQPVSSEMDGPSFSEAAGSSGAADAADAAILELMGVVNAQLQADERDFRVAQAEWLAGPGSEEIGRTVAFRDVGNRQTVFDFVPGDPRRAWSGSLGAGDDITWASDLVEGDAGPGLDETQTAIDNAMATWDAVTCSDLPLTKLDIPGNLGFLQALLFGVGSGPAADITQAGFGTLLDLLLPPPIIAATFTFQFINPDGTSTDIDNNGKPDAALREVYYTNNFPWGINTGFPIDVETVALHENGHSLSQAHFGTLFQTDANGFFHFSPRAVMNAGYTGVQQSIGETDNAGHCSNWADWPNN
jgi:hypothetical protein